MSTLGRRRPRNQTVRNQSERESSITPRMKDKTRSNKNSRRGARLARINKGTTDQFVPANYSRPPTNWSQSHDQIAPLWPDQTAKCTCNPQVAFYSANITVNPVKPHIIDQ